MKAGIFYFTTAPTSTEDQLPVFIVNGATHAVGYVRVEVVDVASLTAALDIARPRPGEAVMNTHWVKEDA